MQDALLQDSQYPLVWEEYIGQAAAKRKLQVMIDAARKRNQPLPHMLIACPFAGVGKTALALMICREMGANVYMASGDMGPGEIMIMFSKVEDGAIIFIDEFHKVMDKGRKGSDWLLHVLANGVYMTPAGPEAIPKVTILGATTDKNMLSEPLQERLDIIELVNYTDQEGDLIAGVMSMKVLAPEGLPAISDDVATAIARASNNQPRSMRKILMNLRDLAVIGAIDVPKDGAYELTESLEMAGVQPDGLTKEAVNYLRVMYVDLRAQVAGKVAIQERLGLGGRNAANSVLLVEQLLLSKNLLIKTSKGRQLSPAGVRRSIELFD